MAETAPALRRFWTQATARADAGGWRIWLDDKPLRTPKRQPLQLPGEALAQAIAAEWHGAAAQFRPADLPLTGLANAALDIIPANRAAMVDGIVAYADADLLCYRAATPDGLCARQQELWEPPLRAIERQFGVQFQRTTGILHVAQPASTLAAVRAAITELGDFELAAVQPLVTLSGSLMLVLAQRVQLLTPDAAFAAASLDDDWQQSRWGADAEAQARIARRRQEYLAASRFLALLANCP